RPLDNEGRPMARWRWWWIRLAEP
ncbi:toxin-antitoxin system YwqK family antitoxin, partial [Pseudomonas aeruginosa]|nr:toxin-antitoxin system YwqK family antitoxin [Pseudomonas aeruginosa]